MSTECTSAYHAHKFWLTALMPLGMLGLCTPRPPLSLCTCPPLTLTFFLPYTPTSTPSIYCISRCRLSSRRRSRGFPAARCMHGAFMPASCWDGLAGAGGGAAAAAAGPLR
eukprot:1151144-Pelagomonas_calceolata.AAC.1